jgi:hypothetical protein
MYVTLTALLTITIAFQVIFFRVLAINQKHILEKIEEIKKK